MEAKDVMNIISVNIYSESCQFLGDVLGSMPDAYELTLNVHYLKKKSGERCICSIMVDG